MRASHVDDDNEKSKTFDQFASTSNDRDETLLQELQDWVLRLQSTFDTHRSPIQMQDEVMSMIFVGGQHSKGKRSVKKDNVKRLSEILLDENFQGLDSSIPQNIDQVMKMYEEKGLITPEKWRICIGAEGQQHPPLVFPPSMEDTYRKEALRCLCVGSSSRRKLKRDCEVCCERCHKCGKAKKEMVYFEYLSIIEQLKTLCKSQTFCYDFLTLWRARGDWHHELMSSTTIPNVFEFWHGEKMRIYQAFWDPNCYWELPFQCTNDNCGRYYRTFPIALRSHELEDGWKEDHQEYNFLCSTCTSRIRIKQTMIKGDPRNFALMCHWDGFQAATTKQKDSGVVEVVVLNGGKKSIIGPLPIIFLPLSSLKLEKKHGDVFPCFLKPLVDELEIAFMNGFTIDYNYPASSICENLDGDLCTLRAILMTWTRDHPAQCKLGQLKDGGKNGCRRDKPPMKKVTEGLRIPKYVYTQNRFLGRFPAQKRDVHEMYDAICLSKRKSTKEQCNKLLSEAGLTGESPLWILYHIYGFDISKDLVYDVMHVLSLNIFKKYTRALFERASTQMVKDIDQAIKEVTNAAPRTLVRQGRWPSNASKHHASFVAEEHQKFIQWCLPHILNRVSGIDEGFKNIGMLLIDIAHVFYNYTRTHGWSMEDINASRQLLLAWRIITEEEGGENVSPLEHVAGNGEMLDDVVRHGSHDGTWCYIYERSICGIVDIPTNNRFNESTYTHYHNRILLSKTLKQLNIEKDGLSPTERIFKIIHENLLLPQGFSPYVKHSLACHNWHTMCLVISTSIQGAMDIFESAHRLPPCPCLRVIDTKGVVVSPLKRKQQILAEWQLSGLRDYWGGENIETKGIFYSKVLLRGNMYKTYDNVIVDLEVDSNSRLQCQVKGVCNIKMLLSHEHKRNIQLFFAGEFMNAGFGMEGLLTDKVTGMKIITDTEFTNKRWCILPIFRILHKCFFLPLGNDGDQVIYEMSDTSFRSRLLEPGYPGCPRPWMEKGDVVLVADPTNESFRKAVVSEVDKEQHAVKLGFLIQDSTNQDWALEDIESTWHDWSICMTRLQGWSPIYIDSVPT